MNYENRLTQDELSEKPIAVVDEKPVGYVQKPMQQHPNHLYTPVTPNLPTEKEN